MPPIEANTDPEPDEEPDYEVLDDSEQERWKRPRVIYPVQQHLSWYIRGFLVAIAVSLSALFTVAACLRPYADDGSAKTMETHMQLGLPKCSMVEMTGKPCPACGMTTSFSLVMHGDIWASMKANWVGTLLAISLLCLIPWAIIGAARGRYLFIRSLEVFATICVCVLLVLMLGRWAYIWFVQ